MNNQLKSIKIHEQSMKINVYHILALVSPCRGPPGPVNSMQPSGTWQWMMGWSSQPRETVKPTNGTTGSIGIGKSWNIKICG